MGVIIGVDPHKASCTAAVLDERGELVNQQRFAATRTGSRAQVLLADLLPGGAKRNLDADAAAALLRRLRPATAAARTRRLLAADLIADLRALDRRIAAVEERLRHAVHQSATTLIELFGIGPILAAKLLGEVGDVRRFATKHRFAAHAGTAPIEASSGEVVRHRLSRAGNRKLNHALT
jgi:transposase